MIENETRISDECLHYFKTFGFVVFRRFLPFEDLEVLSNELEEGLSAQFPHEPFDGSRRHSARMFDESTPFFASLMEDSRFLTPAQQICGEDVLAVGIDANRYVGNTIWHPDSPITTQSAVKYVFYLDPVSGDSGALRVIPGTHLLRGQERIEFTDDIGEHPIEDIPCTVIDTEPGDVIAFDIRIWHASYGGGNDRRSCNLDYFKNPQTPKEIEEMLDLGARHARSVKTYGTKGQFKYPKTWLDNPHNSPIRKRWIDRFYEMGYFDQPNVGEV